MIKIVAYTPEHLKMINLKDCHAQENTKQVGSHAITLMNEGTVIAILGGYAVAEGILQAWALVSRDASRCPYSFHKTVKEVIASYFHLLKLRRMQMSVRTDYQEGWKWAHRLGFNCEGIMRRYGHDGSDYWLFARTT